MTRGGRPSIGWPAESSKSLLGSAAAGISCYWDVSECGEESDAPSWCAGWKEDQILEGDKCIARNTPGAYVDPEVQPISMTSWESVLYCVRIFERK